MLRIGLIGAGGMGLYHAGNIYKKTRSAVIGGFFEPNNEQAAAILATCGNPKRFNDPVELINSEEIDAIVIASPDSTHAKFVLECLNCKKPVLCEKPLAADLDDAVSIISKESSLGKKYLSVGFQRRFDPYHLAVKNAAESGEIGSPLLWKGIHRNPKAMYNTEGAFIIVNSAGHDVDSARWLLQSDVKTVKVLGRRTRNELPDQAGDLLLILMEMENGTLAQAEVFVNADYAYEVMVELVCQRGTATTGHTDRAILRARNKRSLFMSGDFRGYFDEAYFAEMIDWTDSIIQGRSFNGADAWDGYSAVAATFAGVESLRDGKTVALDTIKKPELYNRG